MEAPKHESSKAPPGGPQHTHCMEAPEDEWPKHARYPGAWVCLHTAGSRVLAKPRQAAVMAEPGGQPTPVGEP